MNDAQIYDTVKDLCPTALPEGLVFEAGWVEQSQLGNPNAPTEKTWMLELDGVGVCDAETGEPDTAGEEWKDEEAPNMAVLIPAYHAMLMHEASLTRYLNGHGYKVSTYATDDGARVWVRDFITGDRLADYDYFFAPTILQALAAACREVKK